MQRALLDTCVLWPSLQRDLLLSLAVEQAYRPCWSSAVIAELEHHEALKLQRLGRSPQEARLRAARLTNLMDGAFPDASVRGWEPLEGTFGLPDEDDEHVVAAALAGDTSVIVTLNTKDFPVDRVPASITVVTPAAFVHQLAVDHCPAASRAVDEIAARSGRRMRALTRTDVLDVLTERYGMDAFASRLRSDDRVPDGSGVRG